MSDTASTESDSSRTKKAAPSLLRSAGVVAAVTILSKVLGLARDQMIAHGYGASLVSDAYNYAFQIPSFALVLLGGLGGPFHTATVSVLSRLVKPEQPPDAVAQRITNTFITLTALMCGVVSILLFWFAPQVIGIIAKEAPAELKALAAEHLRWMSPMIVIGGVIGIFYGVANVYHRFFWPSFSPSAINITLIVWLLLWQPDAMGYALAISTLLGALLQLAIQLPDYFATGFRLFPAWNWKNPELNRMSELLFPAMIGTTIGQLNIYVAMFFVSQLEPGGWTATVMGNRLIQFPIGILMTAMLVPLFPLFTRWVHEKDFTTLRRSFSDGVLSLWMLSFPIIALIFLVGESGVRILFEHGRFTPHDTRMVASVLMVLSLSIVPYMLRDSVTRIFYAFNDSRTPLLAGLASIAINALLNALLAKPFGIAGVAFSQVAVTIWNATVLSWLVRRHIRDLGLRTLWGPAFKMVFVALVAAGFCWAALIGMRWVYGAFGITQVHLQALFNLLAGLVVVGGSYGAGLLLLRIELAHRLLAKYRSRFIKG